MSTRGRTQRGRPPGTPPARPPGVNPRKTSSVAELEELMREMSPRANQDGDASIPPANASRSGTLGLKPQNLDARLRTTEQKILLTQSELDARVAAAVDARVAAAVDARVAAAVAAALAESPPTPSQGSVHGPAVPPLAQGFGLDVSSGVPGRRKTERTRQSTPLSKKKGVKSTATFWDEEDAATAGNAPAATSPATELLRDASPVVLGRRKAELTGLSTPASTSASSFYYPVDKTRHH